MRSELFAVGCVLVAIGVLFDLAFLLSARGEIALLVLLLPGVATGGGLVAGELGVAFGEDAVVRRGGFGSL